VTRKVVLFFPETHRYRAEDIWCLPPFALLAIAAPLVRDGWDVRIIDSRVDPQALEHVLAAAGDAVCVGVTALTGNQIREGLLVSEEMKKRHPQVPVVWGGYHATLLPEQTILDPAVDVVVRGQGEQAFQRLVEALREGASLRGIPGVIFKEQGRVVFNDEALFTDVNQFPPLPFGLVDLKRHLPDLGFARRTLAYVSSQGCPHDCEFCAESTAYKVRWSGLKAPRVGEDLQRLLAAQNADGVIFVDNNFFVNEARVQAICQEILDRGLRISWAAQGRADRIAKLSGETFRLLRESGFKVFHVGAESGSDEVLEMVSKGVDRQTTLDCALAVKRAGLHISFGFIFGFPGETEADREDNFSLMEAVTDIQGSFDCIVHFYAPAPGTPLVAAAVAHGAAEPATLREWIPWNTVRGVTPWIDAAYLDRVKQRVDCYYPSARPNWMLRRRVARSKLARVLFALQHGLSAARYRFRYFGLPVEWWLLKRLRRHLA